MFDITKIQKSWNLQNLKKKQIFAGRYFVISSYFYFRGIRVF